jgi:hypothetical protein
VALHQQRVTEVSAGMTDDAATKALFTASGLRGELHAQTLPKIGGGTVSFLATASTADSGYAGVTAVRVFAEPRVALSLILESKDPSVLHEDIEQFVKNARVEVD